MPDSPVASSNNAPDTDPSAANGPGIRWKPAAVIACGGATAIAGIVLLTPDQTFRIMGIYYGVVVWALVGLIWWLFFSGVRRSRRIGVLVVMVASALAGWLGLVRRLEFNGAMAPMITWRWDTPEDQQRANWLREQSDTTVADPALDEPFVITQADWPRYCGADGSRIVREPITIRDWSEHPPKLLWKHPIGEGWSSFAVVGPRLFTQEQRGDDECIVCYHADSGSELWIHRDKARYATAMGGIGPRATPTVTPTGLYALGATGLLTCLDPVTGTRHWQRNIAEDASSQMPQWGFSGSPLIWNDTVIVVAGGTSDRGVLAYDRDSGEIVWGSGNHHPGYSSPRVETVNEASTLLCFHGDGLAALLPGDGRPLWTYPFTNMYQVNVAQPILVNDMLFIGTGYNGHCVSLNIEDNRPAEAWRPNRNLRLKFNEAVERDGYIYGLDDGILCCVDAATGKRQWKGGRYNFGQILLWQDTLLVQAEKGYLALVSAAPDRYVELTRFAALRDTEGTSDRFWNVPVVNRSRLYMRSDREVACFELPQHDN